jgi:hypothetical protein
MLALRGVVVEIADILISFVVQQVIIFLETGVGLYDVHTVSNRLSGLVAKNVTKSVTYS